MLTEKKLNQVMREEAEKFLQSKGIKEGKFYDEYIKSALEGVDFDNEWDSSEETIRQLYEDWLVSTWDTNIDIEEANEVPPLKKIILTDYSQYVSGKSVNGGGYSFTTVYEKREGGWIYYYTTSAAFEYNSAFGVFESNCDHEEAWSIVEGRVISTEDVLVEIIGLIKDIKDKDYEIEIERE